MSDAEILIWERWRRDRDADAFAEILSRYAGMVFSTSKRILSNAADAEEITQDCFVELLRFRGRIRMLPGWLHAVAVRRSLDRARAEKRRRLREAGAATLHREPPPSEDGAALQEVDAAVEALPEKYRRIILLRFMEGRTHQEIAARLAVPESTVRHRLERGIEKMRSRMGRRGIRASGTALIALLGTGFMEAAPAALASKLGKLALAQSFASPAALAGVSTPTLLLGATLMKFKTFLFGFLALFALLAFFHHYAYRHYALYKARQQAAEQEAQVAELAGAEDLPPPAVASIPPASGDPIEIAARPGEPAPPERAAGPRLGVLALDEENRPIPGAEVFLAASVHRDGRREESTGGPRSTGADGMAWFEIHPPEPPPPSAYSLQWQVYARVPGKLAGIADLYGKPRPGAGKDGDSPAAAPADERLQVVLHPVAEVGGSVFVPHGFDPRLATVRVMSIGFQEGRSFLPGPTLTRDGDSGRMIWPEIFEARPDRGGIFALRGMPSGATLNLAAEAPGLGAAQERGGSPEKLRRIVFNLAVEGIIEGVLRFKDDGKPAAGVTLEVRALESSSFLEPGHAASGPDGRFRFSGLGADSYCILLPAGFDRTEWTLQVHGPIRLDSGTQAAGLELFLEHGARVSGRVLDAGTGGGVPGAWIGAVHGPEVRLQPNGSALTDAEGRYLLRLPAGRSKVYLMSIPAGFSRPDPDSTWVTIGAGDEVREGIDFTLSAGKETLPGFPEIGAPTARARGRVVDAAGAPIPGISIQAHRLWEKEAGSGKRHRFFINPVARARTDADGMYEVSMEADRFYRIAAVGESYSSAWSAEFQAADGEAQEVEDLKLRRGTASIAGRLVDPEGRPVEGAGVQASSKTKLEPEHGEESKTDAAGAFRIDGLLDDEVVSLLFHKIGFDAREVLAAPGSDDLRCVFHPEAREPAGKPDAERSLKNPGAPIGEEAPAWRVEEWVQGQQAPPQPRRDDGRWTVLIFAEFASGWAEIDAALDAVEAVERAGAEAGAIPVFIAGSNTHPGLLRLALARRGLRLAAAADALAAGGGRNPRGATRQAYGGGGSPRVFLIDPAGAIRRAQNGVDGIAAWLQAAR